ncbi:MAG: TIGR04282 family arsenosugar biosynthesis glycosyltransferase [Candidatus Tectomicrobia bacterium]|uniref:TIGR04282 family arsenosugar biosynthesis glycosyltransferase n=1 Tax=Tectimicrobiota bacterium TaxID=2528274 RepID=A0A933GKK5_UNCTE|nr:TIGR04282 family arsenosugar biosynthesis glycosyltransferase [Candidatus Tectomicrobia bacterium]
MNEAKLIIFTRFPEPGRVKTRLIPILGERGAAELQRSMTRYTLDRVKEWESTNPHSIEVWFDGGDQEKMWHYFGQGFIYRRQPNGDLGDRMHQACKESLESGYSRVVIIGTDCPSLTTGILQSAFDALIQNDLVLGPANDGGYYLIGLRKASQRIFEGIPWGTHEVSERTIEIARSLKLSVALLDPLNDIDRPEDLKLIDLGIVNFGIE